MANDEIETNVGVGGKKLDVESVDFGGGVTRYRERMQIAGNALDEIVDVSAAQPQPDSIEKGIGVRIIPGMIASIQTSLVNIANGVSFVSQVFDTIKGNVFKVSLEMNKTGIITGDQSLDGSTNWTQTALIYPSAAVNVSAVNKYTITAATRFFRVSILNTDSDPTTIFRVQICQMHTPESGIVHQGLATGTTPWTMSLPITGRAGSVVGNPGSENNPLHTGGRYCHTAYYTPMVAGACIGIGSVIYGILTCGETAVRVSYWAESISSSFCSDKVGTLRIYEKTYILDILPKLVLQLPYINAGKIQSFCKRLLTHGYLLEYTNGPENQTLFGLNMFESTVHSPYHEKWTFALTSTILDAPSGSPAVNDSYTSDHFISAAGEYSNVGIFLSADKAGILYVEESQNGSNWYSMPYVYAPGEPLKLEYTKTCDYLRLRYVNGAEAQGSFLLVGTVSN